MNKAWALSLSLLSLAGCGSHESYAAGGAALFPTGVYVGLVGLISGSAPPCSQIADPSYDACCDDSQNVGLTVVLDVDGYYVDGWTAYVDNGGSLIWQESFNDASGACAVAASTSEALSLQYIYSFASSATQTCAGAVSTVQCAYQGQLILQ